MQDNRSPAKQRETSQHRTSTLVVLGLLIVVAAAVILGNRFTVEVAEIDIDAPVHYFIPLSHEDADTLSCNFDRGLDRSTSHNLWSSPLQPCSLVRGWANPGSDAVMATARRSALSFFTERTDWTRLELRVRAEPHPAEGRVQTMKIRFNRRTIGTIKVPVAWRTVAVPIPAGLVRKGVNSLSLEFAYRAPGAASKKRKSIKPLVAIHLQEVALTTSGRRRALFRIVRRLVPIDPPSNTWPVTQIYDPTLERFVISQAGTLVRPVAIPDNAEQLEIDFLAAATSGLFDGRIILNLQGMVSGASVSLPFPTFEDGARSPVSARIPVTSLAGETCVFWIDVEGQFDGLSLAVSEPRIVERPTVVEIRQTAQLKVDLHREQPDIVLITLDAARPHHFSCYGYKRPTTPNIDRLAAESLVFANAFALVPNTLRSVPTMITGLSFLNHLVTEPDSTLSEAATTLAESLSGDGYRTACFSASPNNSRAIAADQGYGEFFELWNEVPRTRSRDPHYLSGRVLEWLASVDNSRPLHLQLHFVPPHAPYAPAARFDLFSDPFYDGELDGSPTTILAIDKGRLTFDASDMKHLIALYDGNLRAADDAVGEVLAALRQRPRWKDTVVLVTSDHGEAFYEHRRMGHNKTVYEEMLRVPFIVRLPGTTIPEDHDLDRLVTLADITPTLLTAASLEPPYRLDGFDVSSPTILRQGTDNRSFIARTADETPTWGLRTRRFKIILNNSGQGQLFDLEADPGEQRNLRFSNQEVFVGLGLLLTRGLIEPPSLSGTTRKSELPESDRKMLEALGYID